MTSEQIEKIIKILITADGGCGSCVNSLLIMFFEEFLSEPKEFVSLVEKVAKENNSYYWTNDEEFYSCLEEGLKNKHG